MPKLIMAMTVAYISLLIDTRQAAIDGRCVGGMEMIVSAYCRQTAVHMISSTGILKTYSSGQALPTPCGDFLATSWKRNRIQRGIVILFTHF